MTRALIVVDVQNDFCEGGSLAVAGGARLAGEITTYIRGGADGVAYVVATRDRHVDPGAHFSDHPDYEASWPRHCVVGTGGADFRPEFDASLAVAVFDKGAHAAAYSGFEGATGEGARLAEWLRARDVTGVDVVGIATDHCVRATALDAAREGFDTRVLLHLTAGVAAGTTDKAVAELRSAGVVLVGDAVVGG